MKNKLMKTVVMTNNLLLSKILEEKGNKFLYKKLNLIAITKT